MSEGFRESAEAPEPVRRRRVLHLGGFEPVAPEVLARRMEAAMERFPPLWNIEAVASPPDLSADGGAMSFEVEAKGPNWQTRTRYTILRWDTVIESYTRGNWLGRTVGGYGALLGFLANGTIGRFFRKARRYGLFSIYPLVSLVLFLLLGWGVAAIFYFLGVPQGLAWLLGFAAFVAMLYWLGHQIYLDFALDHWKFAGDLARRRVAGLEPMLQRMGEEIAAAIRDPEADEVLITGVSLGSVMAVEALSRALAKDPALLAGGRVALLTTGSSFLQVGLHPAAVLTRAAVARVAAEPSLAWLEVQGTTDPVNFPGTSPVTDLGLAATGRPVAWVLRIRDLTGEEGYRRIS
ncbi:MAG: hypothetical protein J0H63_05075, partial [Rhizobiales bacterium]|nr:hypothetical protein [Hyphomicrobiales bacterium]